MIAPISLHREKLAREYVMYSRAELQTKLQQQGKDAPLFTAENGYNVRDGAVETQR